MDVDKLVGADNEHNLVTMPTTTKKKYLYQSVVVGIG